MDDDVLFSMAGGLESDVHEQLDELALEVERTIRKWGDEIENLPDFGPRESHRGVISMDELRG